MKKERLKAALIAIFSAVAGNALITAMFALLDMKNSSFVESFSYWLPIFIIVFGGGFIVGAILILITNLEEDSAIRYGHALFYGTGVCFFAIDSVFSIEYIQDGVFLSAVICIMACRIYWLEHNKK